jgi:uroporphyrin-III C-methyltransferase/precorrin-2 dehydrogenase/sirohydrochlorin ferrochelatase
MEYLPIFLAAKGRLGLVVGGGEIASRKVELLRRAGMTVRVVAPELGEALTEASERGEIEHRAERFHSDMVDGAAVVIAATADRAVNESVASAADQRGIPVNVVDCPELCSFIVPSIVDRSPLVVALSSEGKAPVLARLMRSKLEAYIPAAYSRLADLMGRFREVAKARLPDSTKRRRFWEAVLDGPIGVQAVNGEMEAAEQALEAEMERSGEPAAGDVALVGAGPGDPDLLTLKASRLMQRADVVVYDRLVSAEVLDRVRRDAERISVGKGSDRHPVSQEEINTLMERLAGEGNRVVRLKGGDPFVFGRGSEEIGHLRQAGVTFQVVPGVTAALGCAAYSGIPLTHRDLAHAAVFATGHLKEGVLEVPWDTLVQADQTVVVYMGVKGLAQLRDGLVDRGLSPETPAAMVEQGTTPRQRLVTATLASLPEKAEETGSEPPSLVILGEVVATHPGWDGSGELPIPEGEEAATAFEINL